MIIYFAPLILVFMISISMNETEILIAPACDKVFKTKLEKQELADVESESQIYDYVTSGVTTKHDEFKNAICYIQINSFSSSSEASSVFKNVFAKQLSEKAVAHVIGKIGSEFYIRIGPIKSSDVRDVCASLFKENACEVLCF